MGMIALALPGHSTKTRAEQQADLNARRARARAALDVMARGEQPDGLKKLTEMSLARVSGVADYDEPGILHGWESENKVVYTLEDEDALRGGFDEHVAQLLEAKKHKKRLSARLKEHMPQLLMSGPPPMQLLGAASASAVAADDAEGEEDEGGGEEEGDDAPLDARFDELAHLVGKRVEVQMEDIRGVSRWFAGKARSATRRRGLQVSFDDGERKAFHADEINDASQGTFWRFE